MLKRGLLIAVIGVTLGSRTEAQETFKIRVLGYQVVSESRGTANCNSWTDQNGFTFGSCHTGRRSFVLNAVETDTTRYLLSGRTKLTDVGGMYDAELCGSKMCVHGFSGKHHKPHLIRYPAQPQPA
jgi:hypothetical protein